MAEGNINWEFGSTPKGIREKASELLVGLKARENNVPPGYKVIWVNGPLRTKIKKVVKIEDYDRYR